MPSSKAKPPSGIQSPSFQPPSYYAAANGIPYPRTPRANQIPSLPRAESRKDRHLTMQYEPFMPISYLPDPSSSDSSFEFRPSRKLSGNGLSPNRSTPQGKRRSQIADLPQIEAQLLPSLRDTIDKMTRPPSLLVTPPPISPDGNILHDPYYRHRDNCTDQTSNPLDFSSNAYETQSCDRPRGSLLPSKPRITEFKKSIKSPVPRPSLLKPACPVSVSHTPQHGKRDLSQTQTNGKAVPVRAPTLRSVKSLLTRKLSTTSSSTTPSSLEIAKQPISKDKPRTPTPSSSRLASTLREKKENLDRYPSNFKSFPTEEGQPHTNTLRRSEKPLRSNIPRLRARFVPSPNRSQNVDDTDSSSIEGRYEHEQREQRRLVATNADDPPGSSSDCDSDNICLTTSIRSGGGIGLGLNCHFPMARSPHFQVSEGDPSLKPKISIHETPRSSVTSSASSDSRYSTESDDRALSLGRNVKGEGQRRAALLGLVATLDQKSLRHGTESSESSEYHGQQGIAYSASTELRVLRENALLEPANDFSWLRSPASQACSSYTGNMPASPNKSTPKQCQYRRRSQYMPSPLPLSVPDDTPVGLENDIGRQPAEGVGKEAARLARQSLMAATRERKAFGLKPSDSDMFYQRFENFRRHLQRSSESSASDIMGSHDDCKSTSHVLESNEAREHHVERENSTGICDGTANLLGTKSHDPESMGCTEANPPGIGILRQLLDTEEAFVANMQSCIQTYVLPLRVNGSKAWISGVPPQISRFLDWFEDTLRLHERLLQILRGRPCDVLPQVLKFTPNFEIYQPYIARLEEFTVSLHCSMDEGSDFGHFVALQDKQIRQSGWSLSKYISEPERRLQKYPGLFSALLGLTPRQDPQYLIVFSLLRSMEVIVDVMNTVKQEEERHGMLSCLLARFQGTYSITEMADRERTLLWHGFLSLRLAKEETSNSGRSLRAHRAQRLSAAITVWDAKNHNGLDDSISSQDSVSSYSGSNGDFRDGSPKISSASIGVYAVVLSDLVLFGVHSSDTSKPYRLIDGIGKCRIFTIHELDPSNAFLEVIPIDTIDANPNNLATCIEGLYVSLSDSVSGTTPFREDCFSALRRSARYTTQLWCMPWKFNTVPREYDTTRFLASLVKSGLPLPRSPSGRLPELGSTEGDASIKEREERGWWSFRFHQVMYSKRQMVSNTM